MGIPFVQTAPRDIPRVMLAWLVQSFMPLHPTAIDVDTLSVTSIELGHASDTTLTRASAGVVAVEGTALAKATNKLSFFAATTSAELAGVISNETGSGLLVFATSPALTTPNLGTPSAVTLTSGTGLPISTGVSGLGAGVAAFLGTPNSANLRTAVTDETGTGSLVFQSQPTVYAPILSGDDFIDLPASPALGQIARIDDSNTAAWGATVAGGGANVVIAWWSGAAWKVMGA